MRSKFLSVRVFAMALACPSASLAQPANDVCGQNQAAFTIPGTGGTVISTLQNASADAGSAACAASGADLYYYFTPAQSGVYTFSTCPSTSNTDTVVSIHNGCPANTANYATGVASTSCNDDFASCGNRSQFSAVLGAGAPIVIRVARRGGGGSLNDFTLTVSGATAGESCTVPVDIPAGGGSVASSFAGALADPGAGSCAESGSVDVYYRFTPAAAGVYRFSTCPGPGSLDTVLSIHSGCPATAANFATGSAATSCNDNFSGCGSRSQFDSAPLAAGVPIIIRLAKPGAGGSDSFTLSVDAVGACCNDVDGQCQILAAPSCGAGFTFLGPSSACSPNPCPQPGACCVDATGVCTFWASPGCMAAGGRTFMGVGASCTPNPCRGSCCNAQTCTFVLSSMCSGVFLGGGLGCTPNNCPPAVDSCVEATEVADLLPTFPGSNFFGNTVAISGDTAVVGAPLQDTPGGFDAGAAHVYVRAGGVWTKQAELTADDGSQAVHFGSAVAIDGDTIVVGSPEDHPSGADAAGSAYIFTRQPGGSTWSQQPKIHAAFDLAFARFGFSVAIHGDTVVVGSPAAGGSNQGSVDVFVRASGGSTWTRQATLIHSLLAPLDNFGHSVAIEGDTIIAGVVQGSTVISATPDSGSALVFTRSGTTWMWQQTIVASDPQNGALFGSGVGISGNTAVIAASGRNAAYVFVRPSFGAAFSQQAKLVAPNPAASTSFGSGVGIAGDTIVAAATSTSDQPSGSVFVFVRMGSVWSVQAELETPTGSPNAILGRSAAISGDTVLAGTRRRFGVSPNVTFEETAPVYVRAGATWSREETLIHLQGGAFNYFGASVAISGSTVVIGQPNFSNTGGGAFVYTLAPGFSDRWTTQAVVRPPLASDQYFGGSVAVSGETLVAGAPAAGGSEGAAWVFSRQASLWTPQARLEATTPDTAERFGDSVAIVGTTVLVGAPNANSGAGAVFVFGTDAGVWTQQTILAPSVPSQFFGTSVSLSGETAVIGADAAVYVFVREAGVWTPQARIAPVDVDNGDSFGFAVSADGDTIVVGAPFDDTAFGVDSGSAYVFARSAGAWSQQARLYASDGVPSDYFGTSVAIHGDSIVIGAPRKDTPTHADQGAVYVFAKLGSSWIQRAKITASDAGTGDQFGYATAISDGLLAVGAPPKNTLGGLYSGAAYLYALAPVSSVLVQPTPVAGCRLGSATFTLTAAGGASNTYAWRKNGIPINHIANPTAATPTLLLNNLMAADAGMYDCVVTNNDCGQSISDPAALTVCTADFNCSGLLTVQDLFDFLAAYFSGDLRADFNASGGLSVQDLFDFLAAFFAACP